jgi:uncharacterized protein (DUF1800 family)
VFHSIILTHHIVVHDFAEYEVDAFLKYLMRYPSTAAFVSKKLIQFFGISNPSPGYTLRVSRAFKTGMYSRRGSTFGDGT